MHNINKIITTYNETRLVAAPNLQRKRKTFRDDFGRNGVRRHVHSIWFRNEIQTVNKIHQAVSTDNSLPSIARTNLFNLLKEMDFRYSKISRNSAMTEKK